MAPAEIDGEAFPSLLLIFDECPGDRCTIIPMILSREDG